MRRRLFFWLDKLKITRTERQAISILLIVFTVLLILNTVISPSSPFNDEYYSELDARFQMRTALMQQQEQQILARYSGEALQVAGHDTLPADSAAANQIVEIPKSALININTADAATLQQLRGIGAAYAQRIMEYREQNDWFQTVNELLNIKGIGEKRLEKITPFITLGKGKGAAAPAVLAVDSGEGEGEVYRKIEAEDRTEVEGEIMVESKGKTEGDYKSEEKSKSKTQTKVEKAPFTVNVNKAGAETLQNLSGIGPTYARRIVEYRQLNGPFETKEQLQDIKGIGEKRLAKIKPFIKLTDQD